MKTTSWLSLIAPELENADGTHPAKATPAGQMGTPTHLAPIRWTASSTAARTVCTGNADRTAAEVPAVNVLRHKPALMDCAALPTARGKSVAQMGVGATAGPVGRWDGDTALAVSASHTGVAAGIQIPGAPSVPARDAFETSCPIVVPRSGPQIALRSVRMGAEVV